MASGFGLRRQALGFGLQASGNPVSPATSQSCCQHLAPRGADVGPDSGGDRGSTTEPVHGLDASHRGRPVEVLAGHEPAPVDKRLAGAYRWISTSPDVASPGGYCQASAATRHASSRWRNYLGGSRWTHRRAARAHRRPCDGWSAAAQFRTVSVSQNLTLVPAKVRARHAVRRPVPRPSASGRAFPFHDIPS